jgi:hypothetical protein
MKFKDRILLVLKENPHIQRNRAMIRAIYYVDKHKKRHTAKISPHDFLGYEKIVSGSVTSYRPIVFCKGWQLTFEDAASNMYPLSQFDNNGHFIQPVSPD